MNRCWKYVGCILSTPFACCPSLSDKECDCVPDQTDINAVEWRLVKGISLSVVDPDQSLQQQPVKTT